VTAPSNIVILTGAGISAESGLATFRGPDGLWEGHRVEDVCTPEALAQADLFVSIGTSGAVYPAAGFVQRACAVGADTLELNLEPSAGTASFAASEFGAASALVPAWVDRLLARC
jgi:NAD-dependent deacetylase